MEPAPNGTAGVVFGRFLLLPHRRGLLAGGESDQPRRARLRRADGVVEACGEVVSEDALAAHVWPGQIVQDTGLQRCQGAPITVPPSDVRQC